MGSTAKRTEQEVQRLLDLLGGRGVGGRLFNELRGERLVERYGLGFNHDRDHDQRISAVRIEDVQQVVQRYFQSLTIVTSAPSVVPSRET